MAFPINIPAFYGLFGVYHSVVLVVGRCVSERFSDQNLVSVTAIDLSRLSRTNCNLNDTVFYIDFHLSLKERHDHHLQQLGKPLWSFEPNSNQQPKQCCPQTDEGLTSPLVVITANVRSQWAMSRKFSVNYLRPARLHCIHWRGSVSFFQHDLKGTPKSWQSTFKHPLCTWEGPI